jgi:hypothetical protein
MRLGRKRGAKQKEPFYAPCIDSKGNKRRVRITPKGEIFLFIDDKGRKHLSHSSDIRSEIATVYQYKIEEFEYPHLEVARRREALRTSVR